MLPHIIGIEILVVKSDEKSKFNVRKVAPK